MRRKLGSRRSQSNGTVRKEHGFVADAERLTHPVIGKEHRSAAFRVRPQDIGQETDVPWIAGRKRLVAEQHQWICDQRAQYLEASSLTSGKLPCANGKAPLERHRFGATSRIDRGHARRVLEGSDILRDSQVEEDAR
jgi:hypothetical protein